MPSRIVLFALLSTLPGACRATPPEAPKPAVQTQDEKVKVAVVTADDRRFEVAVELAADPDERARGLMYRSELGVDEGMLFLFPDESVLSFWMRNTLIPLDMLFIRADGTIAGIVHEATPRTETPRTVGKPSRYVLEVNGGWAKRNGVKAGDRVELGAALAKVNAR